MFCTYTSGGMRSRYRWPPSAHVPAVNPGGLKSLFVVRGMVCLGLQQKKCLPVGSSRGGAGGGLFFSPQKRLNELSVHCRPPIDAAEIDFLHHFHFTFEVWYFFFPPPIGNTQPAFLNPSWIPHCESGTLVWHSVFRLFLTVHHWLRSQLLPVRHPEKMASLHEH